MLSKLQILQSLHAHKNILDFILFFYFFNKSVATEQRNKAPKGWGRPPPEQCLQKEKHVLIFLRKKTDPALPQNKKKLKIGLTLKVVTLPIHEDIVDQYDAEDASPEMDVTEQQRKSHILSTNRH